MSYILINLNDFGCSSSFRRDPADEVEIVSGKVLLLQILLKFAEIFKRPKELELLAAASPFPSC